MPVALSEDLRNRVVSARLSGMKVSEICKIFSVDDNSVYRWLSRYHATGRCSARAVGGAKPSSITDDAKFLAFIELHAHSTLRQMADAWDGEVSVFALSRKLKKLGITRKKRPLTTASGMKLNGKPS